MASTEAVPATTTAASSAAAAVTTTTTPKLKNLTQAVTNMIEFQAFLLTDSSALHVAYFWAEWDEPSKAGGAMDTLVSKLAELHPAVRFARIEAEVAEEVSQQFEVSMAPTFIFFKSKTQVDKVEGADAPAVTKRVEKWEKASAPAASSSSSSSSSQVVQSLLDLEIELDRLVTASPVMLFMKGTPSEPKCKFSRQIVEILRAENTAFGSFDILSNEAVRQGLKEKFNWPTFPQLYIDAKLVGGVDIVKELQEAGELTAILPKPPANAVGAGGANTTGGIRARVEHVISSSPVMLFMKGTVADPACGFSERACEVLKEGEIDFKTFDVLADPAMREAVKEYSEFPTYPQLFVYGKLVGGIEALRDLQAKSQTQQQQNAANQKTLSDLLGELYGDGKSIPTKEPLNDRLKRLTHKSPAVLFMKGSADEPRCGFSARAVDTLRRCGLDVSSSSSTFSTFDILSDAEVREGLKIYSNWPTFPQLYIEGKLIGGLDILKELEDEGELSAMLGALKSA